MTKSLPVFVSRADFRFPAPNSSAIPPRQGRAGVACVTASANFHRQVVRGNPSIIRELGSAKLRNLPVQRWRTYRFRGRNVLFLMPPPAIGEHVAIRLFLEAFLSSAQPKRVALLGTDAASDVYADMSGVEVHPSWIEHDELEKFSAVVDLNDVPARRNIDFWPVDMEAELFALFGIEPLPPTPVAPVRASGRRLRVGIFPLASSPIRTLPPPLVATVHSRLQQEMDVSVVLNRQQAQSAHMRAALDAVAPDITYREDTKSLADLRVLMRRLDYAVYADSGPAHLSKLDQRPGVAAFTSAPSQVLFGRHRNLRAIQASYLGEFCEAPCGLAKLRQAEDGRIGCMESLGLPAGKLTAALGSPDPALAGRFLLETPVPCAAALARDANGIAEQIRDDILSRCT